ncbi:snRNA-activating protein complex subunit 4 [Vanessa cardui]|uniref:snRNA-activating protein complex subunit 4 n=1 Tax=Vanessa cardui TaxID=171605 RepID=UPI001F13F50A|nr:snRNA-activating protein complex subunit 4 [Vanessa cardui]
MYDFEEESDEENEIQDLEQLNAVLIDDEPCSSASVSQISTGATSFCSFSSKYEEYSKIETTLALNKMCDEKLSRLEKMLQSRLRECRQKLSDIQGTDWNDKFDKVETFRYVNCGKPYFKDRSNFPAPDNDDTIIMNKSEMYDFSNIVSVPGWTVKDKSQFMILIHKLSQAKRKKELESKIAALKRENKVHENKNDKEIARIKKEMDHVNKMSLKELALPLQDEYDWDYIANKLNYRHSAQEYRSLWKLFLHPSINKNVWSRTEHITLQKVAYDEKLQNWDKIAEKLKTGRTNYQCFVYFRTNMINTFTGRKWTKEEEEYLKRLIEYYKEDNYIPWGKVAASMENRTKIQIYNKYSRMCEHRKGRFLAEEDAVILTCYENFGPNFKKMTKYLPGRSLTQCRVRYQVLAKKRISTVWTIEEDRKLVQLMANQDAITNYSSIAPYFPGKDRVHIRARYLTLSKWMRRNPNVDIAKAPRRGARRLGHGHCADDLNRAIESLKTRIQSEVTDKKSKKVTKDSPENVIEDAIIAHIVTESVKLEEARKIELDEEEPDSSDDNFNTRTRKCNVTNLRKILILLRAKLNHEKFLNSSYGKKYRDLLEPEHEMYTVKVKSYSKQNTETSIEISGSPDIWGNVCLGPLAYVLPPHYSTITGCKKLMSYVTTKPQQADTININVVMRRNVMLKVQAFLLMERFNALFLWPMLLSNTHPDTSITFTEEERQLSQSYAENYPVFDKEDYASAMSIN